MPTLHTATRDVGPHRVTTALRGRSLLNEPSLNKGTAFTSEERCELGLHGLLPPRIETLAEQCDATRDKYDRLSGDLERHIFLRALEDTNEVLYYAFLKRHLVELLPMVYTPTVGEACRQFSHIYRRPHGLFLSYPDRHLLDRQLASVDGPIDVVVVTDGERILGLGDQGLGGMGIPIGKLALYTVVGGVDPRRTLPVLLDVGTNNEALLADRQYLGWRHRRIEGADYDDFVEQFVAALERRFPRVLLQWEDFGGHHATPLLHRYRDRLASFNDDIQGTAAVTLAAVRAAVARTGSTLADQRICIAGAGSAGCGIAAMLADGMLADGATSAAGRLFLTDLNGLVHDRRGDLADFQRRFAVSWADLAPAAADGRRGLHLAEVVEHLRPTVLIGVSGQGGIFSEEIVRTMAAATAQPVIFPLSNPTDHAEATPQDLLDWTDGRAIVATGSPFPDVVHRGVRHRISQANNVYVFPGLGLGTLVANARRVSDGMLHAAAEALAAERPLGAQDGLLPPLDDVARTSRAIARAVAVAAAREGTGDPVDAAEIDARIDARYFEPIYPRVDAASAPAHRELP